MNISTGNVLEVEFQTRPQKVAADERRLDVLIIGAGPIGLACAVEAERWNLRYLVIEKGCVVNSIYHYPTYMHFFSTPELLEIGDIPFIIPGEKPTRQEALEYYRRVTKDLALNVHLYEKVLEVEGMDGEFTVRTTKGSYRAAKVVAAVGFFDHPRKLDVPGESLEKVSYYFHEPHPYSGQDLLIAGSGNSAVEAALECLRHGAHVTMCVRGADFHAGIKYWIRPDIVNRIKSNEIRALFNTRIEAIDEASVLLRNETDGEFRIANDFVLALIGYEPDFAFLERIGVALGEDECRTPVLNAGTWESSRPGLYLAGVVVGGLQTKTWFIENSRMHAVEIFKDIASRLGMGRVES